MFTLQIACENAALPSRRELRSWVVAALQRSARLTMRIVDRREGRRLNRMFRGRDYATNVLTFVYPRTDRLEGDIALCAPVIAREARDQGKTIEAHFAHLVVHGVLHLQGFDHAKRAQARVMEVREVSILARLGFGDPYLAMPAQAAPRA